MNVGYEVMVPMFSYSLGRSLIGRYDAFDEKVVHEDFLYLSSI